MAGKIRMIDGGTLQPQPQPVQQDAGTEAVPAGSGAPVAPTDGASAGGMLTVMLFLAGSVLGGVLFILTGVGQ